MISQISQSRKRTKSENKPIMPIKKIKLVESEKYEPIIHSEKRESFQPIVHTDLWEFYEKHESTFWTRREIDYTEDLKDWNKLTSDEKYYIETVLAFFASSDLIVNNHIMTNFLNKIQYLELEMYYTFQAMMENIHSQTYADQIEALIRDPVRKDEVRNAVNTIDTVRKKAEWANKYINDTVHGEIEAFVRRLVAFSVVEGIFFSGSFCAIFWFKKRGLLPGLCFANELISRDEGLHRDVACYIYKNHIVHKLPESEVIDIVTDGVKIEHEFIKESLPVRLIGMDSDQMCKYIEYVADHLLVNLIGKKHYKTKNPFDWMSLISMQVKTNFFEGRVSQYSKADVTGEVDFDTEDF